MRTLQRFPNGDLPLDTFFQDMLRPFTAAPAPRAFVPAVDVREEADAIVLEVDVPGMKPEQIKLSFEDDVLTIAGERTEAKSDKPPAFHRTERAWGAFERRFQLPREVAGEAIDATVADGVLTIRLSKRPETRPRQIEVKAR